MRFHTLCAEWVTVLFLPSSPALSNWSVKRTVNNSFSGLIAHLSCFFSDEFATYCMLRLVWRITEWTFYIQWVRKMNCPEPRAHSVRGRRVLKPVSHVMKWWHYKAKWRCPSHLMHKYALRFSHTTFKSEFNIVLCLIFNPFGFQEDGVFVEGSDQPFRLLQTLVMLDNFRNRQPRQQ